MGAFPLTARIRHGSGVVMTDSASRSPLSVLIATANLRGIALMIVARVVFSVSDTFTKLASESLPGTEVVSVRNAVAVPIVAAMAWRLGGLRHLSAAGD